MESIGEYRLYTIYSPKRHACTRVSELNRSSPQLTVTRRHGAQQLWLHDVLGLSVGLRWVADDAGPCVASCVATSPGGPPTSTAHTHAGARDHSAHTPCGAARSVSEDDVNCVNCRVLAGSVCNYIVTDNAIPDQSPLCSGCY